MGTAALTVEECCRAHTVSAFLSDAPHASHTHEKLQTFTAPAGGWGGGRQKKKKEEKKGEEHKQKAVVACEFACACAEKLACMRGMQIKTAASVMTVCAAVTCGFPGGPPGPL